MCTKPIFVIPVYFPDIIKKTTTHNSFCVWAPCFIYEEDEA